MVVQTAGVGRRSAITQQQGAGVTVDDGLADGLVEFDREQRRKDCPVCRFSDEVKDQLKKAADKKISRKVQVQWLIGVVKVGLTEADLNDALTTHNNGKHDPT